MVNDNPVQATTNFLTLLLVRRPRCFTRIALPMEEGKRTADKRGTEREKERRIEWGRKRGTRVSGEFPSLSR